MNQLEIIERMCTFISTSAPPFFARYISGSHYEFRIDFSRLVKNAFKFHSIPSRVFVFLVGRSMLRQLVFKKGANQINKVNLHYLLFIESQERSSKNLSKEEKKLPKPVHFFGYHQHIIIRNKTTISVYLSFCRNSQVTTRVSG